MTGVAGMTESGFGDLLRRYRVAAGLTQEELAERAGVSTRGISDLERGAHGLPRKDTLQLLLDALDLSPADRATLAAAARRPATTRARRERGDRYPGLPVPLTPLVGREQDDRGGGCPSDGAHDPAAHLDGTGWHREDPPRARRRGAGRAEVSGWGGLRLARAIELIPPWSRPRSRSGWACASGPSRPCATPSRRTWPASASSWSSTTSNTCSRRRRWSPSSSGRVPPCGC